MIRIVIMYQKPTFLYTSGLKIDITGAQYFLHKFGVVIYTFTHNKLSYAKLRRKVHCSAPILYWRRYQKIVDVKIRQSSLVPVGYHKMGFY